MTTESECVSKTVSDYAEPIRAAIHAKAREVRRAATAGYQAVEDCADASALQVRRHPLAAVGLAAGVGLLVGCVIGIVVDRRARVS